MQRNKSDHSRWASLVPAYPTRPSRHVVPHRGRAACACGRVSLGEPSFGRSCFVSYGTRRRVRPACPSSHRAVVLEWAYWHAPSRRNGDDGPFGPGACFLRFLACPWVERTYQHTNAVQRCGDADPPPHICAATHHQAPRPSRHPHSLHAAGAATHWVSPHRIAQRASPLHRCHTRLQPVPRRTGPLSRRCNWLHATVS
jgi:hypothetical protein